MKAWRKEPNQGAVRIGRKTINAKRVMNKFKPSLVNHGSVLFQRMMLQAGIWAL